MNSVEITAGWRAALALAVVAVSVGLFAAHFSVATTPHFNADQAIHALMAERFDWSRDAYYWGQDRLGSLLPFLGSLATLCGLDGLTAMVGVQAAVLLGCGLLWAWIVRDVLLAAVGFGALLLPPYPFYEAVAVGHPYLGQTLLGLGLLALLEAERRANPVPAGVDGVSTRRAARYGPLRAVALPLVAAASLWASELSVALIVPAAWFYRGLLGRRGRENPGLFAVGGLIGALGLWAAKSGAPRQKGFARMFADPQECWASVVHQWTEWSTTLGGDGNKPFNFAFGWAVVAWILLWAITGWVRRTPTSPLTRALALAAVASWAAVHASGWNAANGFPLRYFAASFTWGALALLSYLHDGGHTKRSAVALGLLGLWGLQAWAAWSFTTQFSTGAQGRLPRAEAEVLLREVLARDSEAVFIGSYWNSYLLDGLSPKALGLPHERDHCRDRRYQQEVLNKPVVVAVAAGWLEVLPDTLRQYGTTWVKSGPTEHSSGTDYARYVRVEER
ncbi:MAG: hypothetical protein RLZZ570_1360 [Bacteroidota bacterium]